MRESVVMVNSARTVNKPRGISVNGFPDPDSKTQYFRDLGRRAAESRIVLSGEEAEALRGAYALLSEVARRGKLAPRSEEGTAASDPSAGRHENAAEGESAASGGR